MPKNDYCAQTNLLGSEDSRYDSKGLAMIKVWKGAREPGYTFVCGKAHFWVLSTILGFFTVPITFFRTNSTAEPCRYFST